MIRDLRRLFSASSSGRASRRSLILAGVFSLSSAPVYADAISGDAQNNAYQIFQTRHGKPMQLERRAPTLQELIQRTDLPHAPLQPIGLRGVRINGLLPKTVEQLGFTYFVVIDNTKYDRMSDIYRDTRIAGKSNFVTADSIIHPYLAFTNAIFADTALTQMVPDMVLLLEALQKVALADYKAAEDAEVREDIERNVAFLAVALKLIKPDYQVPQIGTVPDLVSADFKNIINGRNVTSAIFERPEDFSQFKPTGFFRGSGALQNYFRCREWLSRMAYPVIDGGSTAGRYVSNDFRRSVLLFRALDQSEVLGKPGIELWAKLIKASHLFGSQIDNFRERTLYPTDYKSVLLNRSSDLKVTLNALAEPLFRTKLMLAVRRTKPNSLSSISIFELEDGAADNVGGSNFRLFPIVAQPEHAWLRTVARNFPTDKTVSPSWPVGLLDMYAWGSPMAGNILQDNLHSIDPGLTKFLPELVSCVSRRLPGGQTTPVDSRSWKFFSTYFRPVPENAPAVLRSEFWMQRRLLSALGGWVDSQCAIASEPTGKAVAEETTGGDDNDSASSARSSIKPTVINADGVPVVNGRQFDEAPAAASTQAPLQSRRPSRTYHYLEPAVDLYRLMQQDLLQIQSDLTAVGYLSDKYKHRIADFGRLFQRLQKIAETELRGQQIAPLDKRLLANIDQILAQVDVPLPAVLALEPTMKASSKQPTDNAFTPGGLNLAIGRPGLLYAIYQNPHTQEWTLGRGAVYTYYELPAPLLSQSMWQHRVESGFAQPLPWTQRWQLVQKAAPTSSTTAVR